MQSNPIQQRIELICEKWEEAKKHTHARIVRIQCQEDEEDMVDTFYTYMIGADTPILDIAFHFDAACADIKLYSGLLLKELEEMIDIWNNSQKDKRIEYVPISWKPDYTWRNDGNPAAIFVQNFNRLAAEMNLGENLFAVAILKGAEANKTLVRWMELAVETPVSPSVKFLIHDTFSKPSFHSLAITMPQLVATIPLNLNMPKAMEQVAAMGDPNDPATGYRQVFMKMFNAMTAAKEAEAEKYGHECVTIATQNLSKDPYWITQLVVIYITLGNDKIRYKKKKETIAYADKAVETAIAAQVHFENDVASVLLAQALMFRGTVLFVQGNYGDSYTDFSTAFLIYKKQGNIISAIEAGRMAASGALKGSQTDNGINILADSVRLGKVIDLETARGSTYPGVLELLLKSNHERIISMTEIDAIARNIYGSDWIKVVHNWKQAPDQDVLKQEELQVAGS